MLLLTRRTGEDIEIGEPDAPPARARLFFKQDNGEMVPVTIVVRVHRFQRRGVVDLGFIAPRGVPINRPERKSRVAKMPEKEFADE